MYCMCGNGNALEEEEEEEEGPVRHFRRISETGKVTTASLDQNKAFGRKKVMRDINTRVHKTALLITGVKQLFSL